MVTHYLNLQTQFGEDRCTQFRVIVVTDPQANKPINAQTQKHKQTGPITIHCAAKFSAQCNYDSTDIRLPFHWDSTSNDSHIHIL